MTTTPQPADGAIALLPCPFCGSDAKLDTDVFTSVIQCTNDQCISRCDMGGFNDHGHLQAAIAAWNTRPAQLGGGVDAIIAEWRSKCSVDRKTNGEIIDGIAGPAYGERLIASLLAALGKGGA